VLMCGLPGAGKSTFSRSIVRKLESADGAAVPLQVCFADSTCANDAQGSSGVTAVLCAGAHRQRQQTSRCAGVPR
jgi:predicted kinase